MNYRYGVSWHFLSLYVFSISIPASPAHSQFGAQSTALFAGKATPVTVRFASRAVFDVAPLNVAEQRINSTEKETVKVNKGAIDVDLRPFELRTLRVEFEK